MVERTMIAFNSFDDALLVLQYSTDPEARVAALLFLERLLPSDVQAEMQRRACEVLGFTALTPDGFNAQGGPLYQPAV